MIRGSPESGGSGSRVVLVSLYELGHQPIGLAAAAAALRAGGHEVGTVDLAVEDFESQRFDHASLVAISVPMHTAARLGVELASRLRREQPEARLCFYGLYAPLLREPLAAAGIDAELIGGEYEPALVALADRIVGSTPGADAEPVAPPDSRFDRQRYLPPDRSGLPGLDRYARVWTGSDLALAGYVETTRGCAHRCRHCPLTATYAGRLRLVQPDVVTEDIERLISAGAQHVTFGDPDFWNAPAHSMGILQAMHLRHPDVTADVTIKVEHLLEHPDLVPQLRELGTLFVTSAFESLDDELLRLLDKGHTRDDLAAVMALVADNDLTLRPTWLPFTPWTTVEGFSEILDFVEQHDLVGAVPAVQYGLRVLVPPQSAMIPELEAQHLLGPFDDAALSYTWEALDPRTVGLQRRITSIVERNYVGADSALPAERTAADARSFIEIRVAVLEAQGVRAPSVPPLPTPRPAPGLTEAWFC